MNSEASPAADAAADRRTAVPLLLLQRTVFVYLVVYLAPSLLALLPRLGVIGRVARDFRTQAGAWVGERLLGFEGPLNRVYDGSGDRLVDHLWWATALLVSLLVAALWTALRKRGDNPLAAPWFRTCCRYALAATLLGYGLGKGSQFRPQGFERLVDTYGDSSPMGLLWTFMAFSPLYKFFAGAVECAAAVLLLFRRTTLLGGLLAIAALGNILVLDLSFHVPAKLLVLHLLLLATLLVWPNVDRLWTFFVRGRQPPPPQVDPPLWNAVLPRRLIKALVVAWLLYVPATRAVMFARYVGFARTLPQFHGLYEVERFARSGEELSPDDPNRWVRLAIEFDGNVRVYNKDADFLDYFAEFAADGSTWTLGPWREQEGRWPLEATLDEQGVLSLRGELEGAPLELSAVRRTSDDFSLTRTRPRWVIEFPDNR